MSVKEKKLIEDREKLVTDMLELIRMASVRNIKILAVSTERIIPDDGKMHVSTCEKVLGVECLSPGWRYKTNLPL